MDEELKQNLKEKSTWMRALYMVLFVVIFALLEIVISAVVVFQFVMALLTRNTNEKLRDLGQDLSTYLYQIMLFLTFNSEQRPYPFDDWPKGEPGNSKPKKSAAKKTTATTAAKKKEEPEEKSLEQKSNDEEKKWPEDEPA